MVVFLKLKKKSRTVTRID